MSRLHRLETPARARALPAAARALHRSCRPFALAAALFVLACTHASNDSPGAAEGDTKREAAVDVATTECASFATLFASCLRSLGTPPGEAEARSTTTRENLFARLQKDPASAADVAAQCRANRTRLQAQCR